MASEPAKEQVKELYSPEDGDCTPWKGEWWTPEHLAYVRQELFCGVVICFAQVPESVAFAYLANVEPHVALHAAWMVGLICSFFGGRPGMVNGATGAFAAIIQTFVKDVDSDEDSGVEYLFPSVIVAGLLMLIVWSLEWYKFIVMVPATVMIGFCNGLAIVIGLAQLHPFQDEDTHDWLGGSELGWMILIMLSAMITMEFMGKVPDNVHGVPLGWLKSIPSSLMAIIVSIILEFVVVRAAAGDKTKTIKDVSEFTEDTAFPYPFFLDNAYDKVVLDSAGFGKIFLQGFLLAAVGVIESLMTQNVVNTLTKSEGDPAKTVAAMGVANVISGFWGGMGGNAMIGLSTINGLSGGKGRLSTVTVALGVMCCIMGGYPVLNFIPVSALAGVMIVVVLHTFKWFSLKMMLAAALPLSVRQLIGIGNVKVQRMDAVVILVVCVVTIVTNLAYAVLAGIVISALQFSYLSGQAVEVKQVSKDTKEIVYAIDGPLFFASNMPFVKKFDYENDPEQVTLLLDAATVFDFSGLDALNTVSKHYADKGKKVTVKNMHSGCASMYYKAHELTAHITYEEMEDMHIEPVGECYAPPALMMSEHVEGGNGTDGTNATLEVEATAV
ncbi:hypothetical protein CYMTET_39413 [Cymbomonas tetramitiformis]|uniref:STAS domain-containing protein n=1 Tax=Cymbomonas tetramitiformis TaxID=36881 RepID=A0AAE0F4I3_9CHLO|nr:hypothetical protein CYMTET_39413 [Cymbomonas tetramitiformis]